ncbi:hypothetical protein IMZ48_08375, partial [Candidatus Bathyarchaeota archaeon]|nr:hypothetical protein [Candidatus Bathyarchaeota archaeon]
MYCSYLLISCLLCFSGLVLTSPSPNSSGLDRQYEDHAARVEGNLDARSGPSDSYYDDGNVSRRRKRVFSDPITNRRDVDTPVCSPLKKIYSHRGPMIPMIEAFCTEAAKQGVKDKNSGAITRHYNKVDRDEDSGATPSQPGYEYREDKVDD